MATDAQTSLPEIGTKEFPRVKRYDSEELRERMLDPQRRMLGVSRGGAWHACTEFRRN